MTVTESKVLLVEDEMYLAMMLQDVLEDAGYTVVLASRVEQAVALAASADVDAAILDINVDGSEVYPVAEMLRARGIPFMFTSGYGDPRLPPRHKSVPKLQKPYRPVAVCALLEQLVDSRRNGLPADASPRGDSTASINE